VTLVAFEGDKAYLVTSLEKAECVPFDAFGFMGVRVLVQTPVMSK